MQRDRYLEAVARMELLGELVLSRNPRCLEDVSTWLIFELMRLGHDFHDNTVAKQELEIVLISGKVSDENPLIKERNVQNLLGLREKLQAASSEPLLFLASGMIYTPELEAAIAASKPQYEERVAHWVRVVYFALQQVWLAKGWQDSQGANAECTTAHTRGLVVVKLEEAVHLLPPNFTWW